MKTSFTGTVWNVRGKWIKRNLSSKDEISLLHPSILKEQVSSSYLILWCFHSRACSLQLFRRFDINIWIIHTVIMWKKFLNCFWRDNHVSFNIIICDTYIHIYHCTISTYYIVVHTDYTVQLYRTGTKRYIFAVNLFL